MMKASLQFNENMHFTATNRHFNVPLDALGGVGGDEVAPTPKELLLDAMMGCTAMDVVSILRKMRQEFDDFSMSIETESSKDHPIHFTKATLFYYFKGEKIEKEKLEKAVTLSMTKYCGINYMISKSCKISYGIFLNEENFFSHNP